MSCSLRPADCVELKDHQAQVIKVLQDHPHLLEKEIDGDTFAHVAVRRGATEVLQKIADLAPALLSTENILGSLPEDIRGNPEAADEAFRLRQIVRIDQTEAEIG